MKKLTLGIFGGGTVGGGVLEILSQRSEYLKSQGFDFSVKTLCVKDVNKKRSFSGFENIKITDNIDEILNDSEIDIVLEMIGGVGIAKKIVFGAIENGKHVITANKALVEKFMPELEIILEENPQVIFGFEASVGGGIPIINTINTHCDFDKVKSITGILNGTTNFILSKMDQEKSSYQEVLKEAQDLGFAEADPSADVDGHDACAKISILSKLAWGKNISAENIWRTGITQIKDIDFAYAKLMNGTIKLIAHSEMDTENNKCFAFVAPTFVPWSNTISHVNGATNLVDISSEFLAKTTLIGEGAGSFPTANSIVADLINVAKQRAFKFKKDNYQNIDIARNFPGKFYLRFTVKDDLGIIRQISEIFEQNKILIDAIHQLPVENRDSLPFVITTEKSSLQEITKACEIISKLDFSIEKPLIVPIME
jgi:homoserine dehydrogenase/predicted amino acid-binding ACT domain protein